MHNYYTRKNTYFKRIHIVFVQLEPISIRNYGKGSKIWINLEESLKNLTKIAFKHNLKFKLINEYEPHYLYYMLA